MIPAFLGLFGLFAAVGAAGGAGGSSDDKDASDPSSKPNPAPKADTAISKAAAAPAPVTITAPKAAPLQQTQDPPPDPAPQPVAQQPDPTPPPAPAPAPQPDPVAQQPDPDPAPQPQPAPAPAPPPAAQQPDPTTPPTPVAQQPDPDPAPQPAPTPDPDPVAQQPDPDPAPAPQPAPAPAGPSSGPETIAPATFTGSGTIDGGRVTTFEINSAKDIAEINVSNMPEHGNVVVNPDNSVAVVMTGSTYSGPLNFELEINYADGTSATQSASLDVATPTQDRGWGEGKHYILEEDENGEIIVETGENHRPVYITEGSNGLTKAEIAAMEGMNESEITTQWLVDNPEYGGSESKALATSVGMDVWNEVTGNWNTTSNWLLLEKGYTYSADDMGSVIPRGADGESELNPLHVTSWGDGERPIIDSRINIIFEDMHNIVISDVVLSEGMAHLGGENLLLDDVLVNGGGLNIQNLDGFTIHDSEIAGVSKDDPVGTTWEAFADRSTGLFTANMTGVLIEDTIFHRNGWEEGYDGTADNGQPPSQWSHNVYLNHDTFDVTFRDNIVSQGSSWGLMARGGGYLEDNLFIDNNAAVSFDGGNYKGAGHIGNFTLFTDNVITSGAHKEAPFTGALTVGVQNKGELSTMLDNIIAHMADPNDPADIAKKYWGHDALSNVENPFYDDTIIYAWDGVYKTELNRTEDKNTDGLDKATLDQTTIQLFAEALLGQDNATISNLMDYVVSLGGTDQDDTFKVDDIIEYFQNGFGIDPNGDEAQTEHTFVPNDLADGVRWDNRLNWDTDDAPDDGDSVDLNGNWVQYGGTTKMNDVDLGSNGKLFVNNGKLTVEGDLEAGEAGGTIFTEGTGQFWTEGYEDSDRMTFDIDGGRFANTGEFTGTTSIHAKDGQTLLAVDDARMVIGDGSELRVDGTEAKVGFDGESGGNAVLQMTDDSTLTFVADENGFGTIQEFRSGHFDQDGTDVQSGVSLDGMLQVDVSGLNGATGSHTLIEVDALTGVLDDIHIHGLAANQDAELIFDYDNDQVFLNITSGNGNVEYFTDGDPADGSDEASDLWAALTSGQGTYDDTPPEISDEDEELPDLAA